MPIILQNKTNINRVKIKGKNGLAFEPAVSLIILATKVESPFQKVGTTIQGFLDTGGNIGS